MAVVDGFHPRRWLNHGRHTNHNHDCRCDEKGAKAGSESMLFFPSRLPVRFRANIFFQIQATVLISELVAPPIGSMLMTRNVWLPMVLGLVIQAFCIGVALFIPETRDFSTSVKPLPAFSVNEIEPCLSEGEEGRVDSLEPTKTGYIEQYRQGMRVLQQQWDVILLVLTFLIASIGRSSLSVFLQYVSKRYGWILAKVGAEPPSVMLVLCQSADFEFAPRPITLSHFGLS